MNIYLANQTVAWQIPPGRIARFYSLGYYLPPDGWKVKFQLDHGVIGFRAFRRPRKDEVEQANFISQEIPGEKNELSGIEV